MTPTGNHKILKQSLELGFGEFPAGTGIQEIIRETYYNAILPGIEKAFDDCVSEKYSITIDKLEIDCGILDAEHWQRQLTEQTIRLLQKDLNTRQKKENAGPDFEDLVSFLETGRLPWNFKGQDLSGLEAVLAKGLSTPQIRKLSELFLLRRSTAQRLVYRFSDVGYFRVAALLGAKDSEAASRRFEEIEKKSGTAKTLARISLLEALSSDRPDTTKPPFPEDTQAEKNIALSGNRPEKKTVDRSETIYVDNAGLLLLHPFLPELFRRTGILEGKDWREQAFQHAAIYMLQYLATGETGCAEQDLVLNKILCGMEPAEVLAPVTALPDATRRECDELLQEVIRHWSKLKNTSVETLRHSFLRRNAKLTASENGWIMVVEQSGIDILLNSLPWGIGTIRLPWNEKTIHVEWVA